MSDRASVALARICRLHIYPRSHFNRCFSTLPDHQKVPL